jgi:hypothetical protein
VKNGSGAHLELIPMPNVIKFFEARASVDLCFGFADTDDCSCWLRKISYIFGPLG